MELLGMPSDPRVPLPLARAGAALALAAVMTPVDAHKQRVVQNLPPLPPVTCVCLCVHVCVCVRV